MEYAPKKIFSQMVEGDVLLFCKKTLQELWAFSGRGLHSVFVQSRVCVWRLAARYYLTGSFCEWSMTEMFSTGEYVYSTQLTCLREVNEFQILRNMDESQSFFPSDDQADFSSDVVGPCAGLGNFSWCIVAEIGVSWGGEKRILTSRLVG